MRWTHSSAATCATILLKAGRRNVAVRGVSRIARGAITVYPGGVVVGDVGRFVLIPRRLTGEINKAAF